MSTTAPEAMRKTVNDAGPMASTANAPRHSTEFAAKATMVSMVNPKVRPFGAPSLTPTPYHRPATLHPWSTGRARFGKLADQVSEGVKVAANEVQDGLRIAAADAKKVAGIGIGQIDLELPGGSAVQSGDTLSGTLRLTLTEPVEAKRLIVALRATRRQISFERGDDGKHDKVSRKVTLHREVIELGGQRLYEGGDFPFALYLPELGAKVDQGGVLGDVLRAAQALDDMRSSPVEWRLLGMLEIPWRRNLSKKLPISVRAG